MWRFAFLVQHHRSFGLFSSHYQCTTALAQLTVKLFSHTHIDFTFTYNWTNLLCNSVNALFGRSVGRSFLHSFIYHLNSFLFVIFFFVWVSFSLFYYKNYLRFQAIWHLISSKNQKKKKKPIKPLDKFLLVLLFCSMHSLFFCKFCCCFRLPSAEKREKIPEPQYPSSYSATTHKTW